MERIRLKKFCFVLVCINGLNLCKYPEAICPGLLQDVISEFAGWNLGERENIYETINKTISLHTTLS
jgi:hypothetical protein